MNTTASLYDMMHKKLDEFCVILASESPRRKELFKKIIPDFEIITPQITEKFYPHEDPIRVAKRLSQQKAEAVLQTLQNTSKNYLILAADTLVVKNKEIFGKPKSFSDAFQMLTKLSQSEHFVITAFTLINTRVKKMITHFDKTKVFFRKISRHEIKNYIHSKEPFGKAGSYAIQGRAHYFVKHKQGSTSNIIGLPLEKLTQTLLEVL